MATTAIFDKRSKLIMSVDDTPEILTMIKEIVVGAGYNFVGARNAEHCMERIVMEAPHFILLDVQMPDKDGFELCRELRARDASSRTPITFLTARKSEQDVRKAVAVGGDGFITKPFTVKTLLRHIDHWAFRSSPNALRSSLAQAEASRPAVARAG